VFLGAVTGVGEIGVVVVVFFGFLGVKKIEK
jgi:hypothetical protein